MLVPAHPLINAHARFLDQLRERICLRILLPIFPLAMTTPVMIPYQCLSSRSYHPLARPLYAGQHHEIPINDQNLTKIPIMKQLEHPRERLIPGWKRVAAGRNR
ncbi:hypothetical protein BO78DRAFT_415768 [Aspergillus sclerotiicarbonarius CBS 121057]|uniref:Uncharacterized protein n=1 Tax=Aspergillus sclerotiicarbonarius (strain CBS 121057 / IBT 28362) TaxID=1448318 RepID=A0A319EXK9_ASPSB|nr:hypothetical protein BO78DRAFT_415768 [Aspergillus sclerotiicarbonarius CBS 121057]